MTGQSPVSFQVNVNRLPAKGLPVEIEADEEARAALAEVHGLLDVAAFSAELLVTAWKHDGLTVKGTVRAALTQACIVTLDPVPATIEEQVDAIFLPRTSKLARFEDDPSGELLIDPDGPDTPELFDGDTIDVGALAEEVFAVALDPYPRKAGAENLRVADDDGDKPLGPLAEKLAALKWRG